MEVLSSGISSRSFILIFLGDYIGNLKVHMELSCQWFIHWKLIVRTFWIVFPVCFLLSHLAKHLPPGPLCPSSPMCGFHTRCRLHSDDHSAWKQVRKSTGCYSLLLFEIPALQSTGQFIALFHQLFLSCRCLTLSRETLTHQAQDKLWWLPESLRWR